MITSIGDFIDQYGITADLQYGKWRVRKNQNPCHLRGRNLMVKPLLEDLEKGLVWCEHPNGQAFEVRLENLQPFKPLPDFDWRKWDGEKVKKAPRQPKIKPIDDFVTDFLRDLGL